MRWPGHLPEGRERHEIGITMDLTASLTRIAGGARPKLDGIDLLRVISAPAAPAVRPLFWRQRRGKQTWSAVRHGPTKYLREAQGEKTSEYLFDVEQDPAEKENLLATRPAEADRLKKLLADWEGEVRPSR
jgi:arylsulfatase A-like enzyme